MALKLTQEDFSLAANTIRGLSIDGVQKAKSGHPGLPMGMADVAAMLFLKYLDHCPAVPDWKNRDRFVLSGGHGSMLLYSLLHLSGYALPLDELKAFRQWDSLTPGHPESDLTPGVETTTGPLAQGCGNAVGMALAESMLAERFNSDEFAPIDHYTYVFAGDGDLMEGLSHEAFSLAGHLGLNKLVLFYDSNSITIEGSTDLACSDDVKRRFQGYRWNVVEADAHDFDSIEKAIRRARREKTRPTIVICTSDIGRGSPNKQGTASAHGEPLGDEEVALTKKNIGLPEDAFFYVPDRVREIFAARAASLKRKARKWERRTKAYLAEKPELTARWNAHFDDIVPENLEEFVPEFDLQTAIATRSAGGKVIQGMTKALPQLVGGSADLAPSTKTLIDDADSVGPAAFGGRNLHFGIREHAMAAMMNGMALHGGLRVFGATFFVFLDYCRPSVRLAAIMGLPTIYVFTHDSFYVGEDGPTHQPIEQLASLRCMPNVTSIRPADATETGAAWVAALQNTSGPTAILLTRQNLPVLDRSVYPAARNVSKGAYVLWESGGGEPEVLLIASGSEVDLALSAGKQLAAETSVRVVSMPSWELFEKQSDEYKAATIPASCPTKVAIEAGVPMGWERYVGADGIVIARATFGRSGPYSVLAEKFGFTVENVVETVRAATPRAGGF